MLAEQHYVTAAKAIAACPRRRMRAAAAILHIYRALLHQLLARGHLDEPIRIPAWRKLGLVLHNGFGGPAVLY